MVRGVGFATERLKSTCPVSVYQSYGGVLTVSWTPVLKLVFGTSDGLLSAC